MNVPTLRIARPTQDIARLKAFYCDGLGYEILASFADHDQFDGIMFGLPGAPYHFEFTRHHNATHVTAPDADDLFVLYLPDTAQWDAAVQRMKRAGFTPVSSFNPYWEARGTTFEDPDGRRMVFQNASWPVEGAT